MTRTIDEWIGKTDDAKIPDRVLLRVFLRFGGRCQCGCGIEINNKQWQCDHKVALINGGEHRESNLQPILVEHHKNKTAGDVAEKSLTYRKRKSNYGIKTKRHSWGYGKGDPLKKKVTGELVPR